MQPPAERHREAVLGLDLESLRAHAHVGLRLGLARLLLRDLRLSGLRRFLALGALRISRRLRRGLRLFLRRLADGRVRRVVDRALLVQGVDQLEQRLARELGRREQQGQCEEKESDTAMEHEDSFTTAGA